MAALSALVLSLTAAALALAAPPVASFIGPSALTPSQTGTFSSTTPFKDGDGDSVVATTWDFGDGGTASGPSATHAYAGPGTYMVKMSVTDSANETGTASQQVLVDAPPTAAFSAAHSGTPGNPDAGEQVSFTSQASDPDLAGGDSLSYSWDFGDGTSSTAVNPTHAYAQNGPKTVTLRVTDSHGLSATASSALTVNAPPVAGGVAAAVSPASGQNALFPLVGQSVALTSSSTDADSTNPPQSNNAIASSAWSDSTGWTGSGSGVTHPPYASGGDKSVTLAVTDTDGTTRAADVTVSVNTPPTADFLFLAPTPLTGESITFSQQASDPDTSKAHPEIGQIAKYEWDLDGDGHYDDATGPTVRKTFAAPGDHAVGLRVTDGGGATRTITKTVSVANTRPTAAFTAGPSFPVPGRKETFTSTSKPSAGKSIVSQQWDFDYDPAKDTFAPGDVDATGDTAGHAFPKPGRKMIGLKVTEAGGGIDIVARRITVNAPPRASFRATPSKPVVAQTVTFSSTASDRDGPISQAWDTDNDGKFDDGTGAVAKRAFAKPGKHVVRLRVTDNHGARAIHSGTVHVARRGKGAGPRMLSATVQIAGRTTPRGAHLTMLGVRALNGSQLLVRCAGRSCPLQRERLTIKHKHVRIKRLERDLRAGTVIHVIVTKRSFIGRYVTFTIRKHRAPRRSDRCLVPGAKRPSACPL